MAVEQTVGFNDAFEVFHEPTGTKIVERLTVITRGKKLQRRDSISPLVGATFDLSSGTLKHFDLDDVKGTVMLGFVNEFGSPDCNKQANQMEEIHKTHGSAITIVEFSKQDQKTLFKFAKENNISHPLVSIDHETAIDMGVALEPEIGPDGIELADKFWKGALCRMLVVAGGPQKIVEFIDQLVDQAQQPNYEAALIVAKSLTSQ